MSPVPSRSQLAFTLLELLLVITIIAVLSGLMLPVLGRARAKAQAVGCVSNLRQWGIATFLWSADNSGLLPRDGTPNGRSIHEGWYVDLPRKAGVLPYHEQPWRTNPRVEPGRSLFICPANTRRSNSNNLFHYCLNEHVNGAGTGNQVSWSLLPTPQHTIWLFDNGKLAAVAGPNNVHTNLHHRGAHFLFLDGHVRRYPSPAYWNFKTGKGRWNHPELRWDPYQ